MKLEPGPEWSDARPAAIPPPTFAPSGVAFGITILMWGLVTSPILVLVGATVFVVSLFIWIGELRHEKNGS